MITPKPLDGNVSNSCAARGFSSEPIELKPGDGMNKFPGKAWLLEEVSRGYGFLQYHSLGIHVSCEQVIRKVLFDNICLKTCPQYSCRNSGGSKRVLVGSWGGYIWIVIAALGDVCLWCRFPSCKVDGVSYYPFKRFSFVGIVLELFGHAPAFLSLKAFCHATVHKWSK